MKKINISNYEVFFLDYHEKNLSPELVAELLLFLEQHPELQKEFDAYASVSVNDHTDVVFDEKDKLKKSIITAENFNDFAVANLEGDLNSEEKKQYKKFVSTNPVYKKEDELFLKTKLKADLSVKHPDKGSLKRNKGRVISFQMFYVAAAACVLLMLGIFFSRQLTNTDIPQTAQEATPEVMQSSESQDKNSVIRDLQKEVRNDEMNGVSKNDDHRQPVKHFASDMERKRKSKQAAPRVNSNENELAGRNEIPFIEMKTAELVNDMPVLRLKSLQTFPVYILDEYYAAVEPVQKTPAVVFEDFKKEAVKKLEKSKKDNDDNWFPEDAYDAPRKTRMIDVLASAVNKLTGKKVKLETEYNNKGEMVSYDFSAGPISIKKDFSK